MAVVLVLPLAFLLFEAHGAGTSTILRLVFRPLTATLLWNTVRLTVVVTALCAVIGTAAAWFVERTDLPGRRVWAVLVVVPLAIPDFVVSFGWSSLSTWVQGFRGAVLVMTLAVYPLVYLPVAASFRNADPGQEEVARSLGAGRLRDVLADHARAGPGAIFGGCLLVALVLLAEYGAFEILGYQTFTTEIFTEFNVSFNVPRRRALSLVLVLLSLVVLSGEGLARGRGRVSRRVRSPNGSPHAAGWDERGSRCSLGFLVLVALALGVPVGASVYWMLEAGHAFLTGRLAPGRRLAHRSLQRLAAALATLMALPVALLAVRHRGRVYRCSSAAPTRARDAGPGDRARALLLHRALRRRVPLQSAPLLVLAYAILFFPLALVGVRASRRAGAARPRGGRPLARPATVRGAVASHAAARRAGAGRRLLPGVPLGRDRAHRHADPDPDRCADARHPVLGLPAEPRLRTGRAVRACHHRDRGAAELRARALLRPTSRPGGRRRRR